MLYEIVSRFHTTSLLILRGRRQADRLFILKCQEKYTGTELKTQVEKELLERGYSKETIDEWIAHLDATTPWSDLS